MVVSSRITVLVHTRIHRSIYFKTRGTRTGIVRTCKRSEIEFTRGWLFSFTYLCISLSKHFKYNLYWIQRNNNLLLPGYDAVSLLNSWSFGEWESLHIQGQAVGKETHVLALSDHKDVGTTHPMTQIQQPKDLILQQLRCENPKSGRDMRLRASGTNSCSAVIKISMYQKQT